MTDVLSYGNDVWYHIFEQCPPLTLRVLRRVCKGFYNMLSDTDIYYKASNKFNKSDKYNEWTKYLRKLEHSIQLVLTNENCEKIMFECHKDNGYSVNIDRDDKHLFLRGILITGYNSDLKIKIIIGPIIIDITDPSSYIHYDRYFDNSIGTDKLYYPLFQTGSIPVPNYHNITFELENELENTKIYMVGEYKNLKNKIYKNIMVSNTVFTFDSGISFLFKF